MQQIISFLYKNKLFILFLLLEVFAVIFTIQSHSFHKSKFVNSANFISGGIYDRVNNFKEFLLLKKENRRLSEENAYLKNLIELREKDSGLTEIIVADTSNYKQKYSYTSAKVINNNYRKNNNYLTIDQGSNNGVEPDLGVINSKGIVGITKSVSKNYATVLSVLNVNSRINAKLKHSDHFGSLSWDNNDFNVVQLQDLPVQATIYVGDTVVTGGKSNYGSSLMKIVDDLCGPPETPSNSRSGLLGAIGGVFSRKAPKRRVDTRRTATAEVTP